MPIYFVWMILAVILGWIMTRVILCSISLITEPIVNLNVMKKINAINKVL